MCTQTKVPLPIGFGSPLIGILACWISQKTLTSSAQVNILCFGLISRCPVLLFLVASSCSPFTWLTEVTVASARIAESSCVRVPLNVVRVQPCQVGQSVSRSAITSFQLPVLLLYLSVAPQWPVLFSVSHALALVLYRSLLFPVPV